MKKQRTAASLVDLVLNSTDLNEVAQELIPYLMELTGSRGGSLLVEEDGVLIVHTAYGLKTNRAKQARVPFGVGVTGQSAQSGMARWIPDVSEVENHIEGVPDSEWEFAIPMSHPERNITVVVDLESNTDDRPEEELRETILRDLESIKLPVLNLAENACLRRSYRNDSLSSVIDGEYFIEYLDDWLGTNPDREGLLLVLHLEPRLEDPDINSLRNLRSEFETIGSELRTILSDRTFVGRLYWNLVGMFVPDVEGDESEEVIKTVHRKLGDVVEIKQVKSSHRTPEQTDAEALINGAFVELSFTENNGVPNQERHLDDILRSGEIQLFQQPIYRGSSGSVVGREVLVRGPEESQLHSPKRLFKAAYQGDRVVALDTLIARRTMDIGPTEPDEILFLNVERKSIVDPAWRQLFVELVRGSSKTTSVCVEITEHGSTTELKEPLEELRRDLRSSVKFAIDDFGTGSSNYEAIIDLDPDILKIDRSLISGIDENFSKRSLVESIMSFSTTTDIQVLAEGIEESGEWETLQDLGVEWAQGYFFCRPSEVRRSDSATV